MTADEYFRLLHAGVAPRIVQLARDFAAVADADPKEAERILDQAEVIFAVWEGANGAFEFVPVFGGDRLRLGDRRLRMAALFAPSEMEALSLACAHEMAPQ